MPDINEAISAVSNKIVEMQKHMQFNFYSTKNVKYQMYEKQLFDYATVLLKAKNIIDYKLWEVE